MRGVESVGGVCGRGALVRLDAAPLIVRFSSPRQVTGPTRELCLQPASEDDAALILGDGRSTPVQAVLISADGRRDTLGHDGSSATKGRNASASVSPRDLNGVCLWDHGLSNPGNEAQVRHTRDSTGRIIGHSPAEHPLPPLSATYVAVELRSVSPIRVRALSFWAGQRIPSL